MTDKVEILAPDQWPVWEVFLQIGTHKVHEHAGSVHAPDGAMALQNARDVFGRRDKVTSLWVVPTTQIVATSPSDAGPFFNQSFETPYRLPQFYQIPKAPKGGGQGEGPC